MIILIYLVSIVAWLVGYSLLSTIAIMLWKYLNGFVGVETPTYPVFPVVLTQIILLVLTKWIWQMFGANPSWIFPTLLAVICFTFGSLPSRTKTAHEANQTLWYGGLCGCGAYGLLSLLS